MKKVCEIAVLVSLVGSLAWANGGPFFERHVDGSNAVGVSMAAFEDMMPGPQDRIACLGEALTVTIDGDLELGPAAEAAKKASPRSANPLADKSVSWKERQSLIPKRLPRITVKAVYELANQTDGTVKIRFGFPALYSARESMSVTVDGNRTEAKHLSLDDILQRIRAVAAERIAVAVGGDADLAAAVKRIVEIPSEYNEKKPAESQLNLGKRDRAAGMLRRLLRKRGLTDAQVALVSVFFVLPPSRPKRSGVEALPNHPRHMWGGWRFPEKGVLRRIGALKATQLYTEVLEALAPQRRIDYEQFFRAWGGANKRVSLDLETGEVRERVLSPIRFVEGGMMGPIPLDVYAREEYLNGRRLPEDLKKHLMTVLANLPVTFAFAPINMLVYDVTFAPRQTHTVTVTLKQLPSIDGQSPVTAQFEYIVKTAAYFKRFDRIDLAIKAPRGTPIAILPRCAKADDAKDPDVDVYRARITDYGENLYVAIGERSAGAKKDKMVSMRGQGTWASD